MENSDHPGDSGMAHEALRGLSKLREETLQAHPRRDCTGDPKPQACSVESSTADHGPSRVDSRERPEAVFHTEFNVFIFKFG